LGALITTIFASIAWHLVASAFPLAFLGTPITYVLLRVCLGLEATGLASGAWVLASIHKKFAGFQKDEVYIGTAEERAAQGHGDHVVHKDEFGHLSKLVGNFEVGVDEEDKTPEYSQKRSQILENVKSLRELIKESSSDTECEALERALILEICFMEKVNREQEQHAHIRATLTIDKYIDVEAQDEE
jgi:hypothetical protein